MRIVRIKPEYWDGPEDDCEWVMLGEPEKGRCDITALQDLSLPIPPVQTIQVEMLCGF